MKFSREYTKLQDQLFTTMRSFDAYAVGQLISCETPIDVFTARLLYKFTVPLDELPLPFLQYDLEMPGKSRELCLEKLRSLYRYSPPPTGSTWMTVYLLERVK